MSSSLAHNKKGVTLMSTVILLVIVMLLTISMITFVLSNRVVVNRANNEILAFNIAEAGIDRAMWCLANSSECADPYTGETLSLGNGEFSTTVTSVGTDYEVRSVGTYGTKTKTLEVLITEEATSAAAVFYYGVQIGEGGLSMSNNSTVDGNLYSNGNIDGNNGAEITGDIHVAGGTLATPDVVQDTITGDFIFRKSSSNQDIAQSFKPTITANINYVSLYLKKNSNPGNATVRIVEDDGGQPATTDLTSGTLDASQITTSYGWISVSFSSNPELTAGNTYWIIVDNSSSHKNKYFTTGTHYNSGYGNGVGLYSSNWTGGSWTNMASDIAFKTWMGGGPETYVDNVDIGGDAYANQILNCDVDGDAYFDTDPTDIAGSSVSGTEYPGSSSPAPEALPISEATMQQWKDEAESGGTITGNYTVSGTEDLGPVRIAGNLAVGNGATVNLTGHVWVEGDVYYDNNSLVKLDPTYNTYSGLMIIDGEVDVRNGSDFEGSGTAGSYIMILTTSTSTDTGTPAIHIKNNTDGAIFYASAGLLIIENNVDLKEATAYKMQINNGASVTYESGLANAKFTNGPGGTWVRSQASWYESN